MSGVGEAGAGGKKTRRSDEIYSQRSYSHDEFSNITLIGDPLNDTKSSFSSGGIASTQYDHLNRLTGYKMVGASKFEKMEYDATGNIKKNSSNFGDKEYKYEGPHRHAVTSIGEDKFEYDANGNMTKDPHRAMVYDAQNRLIQVAMANKTLVEYEYDHGGARVSKLVTREDPLGKSYQTKTYYLGDALEIRGDAMVLNVYAGSRKVATRVIGKVAQGLGGGSAMLGNGIELEFRPTMAVAYLLLALSVLTLLSFRPMRLRFGYRCPKHLLRFYQAWRWYQVSLQETLRYFRRHAGTKAFLVFYILLFLVQTVSAPAFAGETGDVETPPSDQEYFYYNHDDHLGSSQLLTEGKAESKHAGLAYKQGDLLQRFEYSPFGQERYVLNPNLSFDPSYTGQLYDVETGLYYYKSRYYNPLIARFIQADTVLPDAKNLQAYNRYSYVNNNPLKYVDPTGHFWGFFRKILEAFIGAFISALTFGILAAPILAAGLTLGQTLLYGLVSGVVGGLIGGAISGGVKGALLGAAMGVISSVTFGAANYGLSDLIGQWGAFAVLAGAGASISFATGGWRGLVMFGAATAGAFAGGYSAKGIAGKKSQDLLYKPNKPHFDFSERGDALRAYLGPDAGPPLAWGMGFDYQAGGGGGLLWGGRGSFSTGVVRDFSTDAMVSITMTQAKKSDVFFGYSAGAGPEFVFFTGNISQFAGRGTPLYYTFGAISFSVTPGSNGGAYFTIGIPYGARGTGFEISVTESYTELLPFK